MAGFDRQLTWWLNETSVTIHTLLSDWTDEEVGQCAPLSEVLARGGTIWRVGPQIQILNRIECLKAFYASQHDWGVMLDDDATLYDKPHHNSGSRLFAEMAANGIAAYAGVDVFFPINPQKIGFNSIWKKDPELFATRHVFKRNLDLKGNMFVVRNFAKEGQPLVFPASDFTLHNEDTLFAIEAVAQGCTVMQCQNIVLHEFSQPSHYGANGKDRKPKMQEGNEWIAKAYTAHGLQMRPDSHLLDKKAFIQNCWGQKADCLVIAKPEPAQVTFARQGDAQPT